MATTISLLSVLVVNDQRDMCEMWQRMIDMTPGMACPAYAIDGETALEMVDEHHPHVVFMDMLMPGMTGDEATRYIQERFPDTVVILYSAYGNTEQQARQAGADAFVEMPIQPAKLLSLIRRIWRENQDG